MDPTPSVAHQTFRATDTAILLESACPNFFRRPTDSRLLYAYGARTMHEWRTARVTIQGTGLRVLMEDQ